MRIVALVGFGLLAACGGSSNSASNVCNNVVDAQNTWERNAAACLGDAGTTQANPCVNGGGNVSSACATAFDNYANCLKAVPNCTPATESAWDTASEKCLSDFGTAIQGQSCQG